MSGEKTLALTRRKFLGLAALASVPEVCNWLGIGTIALASAPKPPVAPTNLPQPSATYIPTTTGAQAIATATPVPATVRFVDSYTGNPEPDIQTLVKEHFSVPGIHEVDFRIVTRNIIQTGFGREPSNTNVITADHDILSTRDPRLFQAKNPTKFSAQFGTRTYSFASQKDLAMAQAAYESRIVAYPILNSKTGKWEVYYYNDSLPGNLPVGRYDPVVEHFVPFVPGSKTSELPDGKLTAYSGSVTDPEKRDVTLTKAEITVFNLNVSPLLDFSWRADGDKINLVDQKNNTVVANYDANASGIRWDSVAFPRLNDGFLKTADGQKALAAFLAANPDIHFVTYPAADKDGKRQPAAIITINNGQLVTASTYSDVMRFRYNPASKRIGAFDWDNNPTIFLNPDGTWDYQPTIDKVKTHILEPQQTAVRAKLLQLAPIIIQGTQDTIKQFDSYPRTAEFRKKWNEYYPGINLDDVLASLTKRLQTQEEGALNIGSVSTYDQFKTTPTTSSIYFAKVKGKSSEQTMTFLPNLTFGASHILMATSVDENLMGDGLVKEYLALNLYYSGQRDSLWIEPQTIESFGNYKGVVISERISALLTGLLENKSYLIDYAFKPDSELLVAR